MTKRKLLSVLLLAISLLTIIVMPVSAEEGKKLYFEEKNGTMMWNPVRGSDGNWFMSFTNMVPGGRYADGLRIENGSNKTYDLYMQVIPLEQDERKDELLELISMKVSLDDKILYEGTASGIEYKNGNLQDVIYLGTYKPGEKSAITVNLMLDKSVGIEYCDLLTKNDWKFMVTEVTNSSDAPKPKVINPPKTGDYSYVKSYIVIILGCLSAMFVIIIKRRKCE